MFQTWFASDLKPKTMERPLEFYLRRVEIAPLVQVPTKSSRYKYFLPVDNPKGKVLGFTLYSNMDSLEDGIIKEGLFKISAKLVPAKNNPAIKYVHIFLVDLGVPPEKVKDTVTKEFILSYTTTEFVKGNFVRRGKMVVPDPQDIVLYLGVDMEITSESTALNYSRNAGGFESVNMKAMRYVAFVTEKDRKHLEVPGTILPIQRKSDLAKDVELLLSLGRF